MRGIAFQLAWIASHAMTQAQGAARPRQQAGAGHRVAGRHWPTAERKQTIQLSKTSGKPSGCRNTRRSGEGGRSTFACAATSLARPKDAQPGWWSSGGPRFLSAVGRGVTKYNPDSWTGFVSEDPAWGGAAFEPPQGFGACAFLAKFR
jgi:hypothetical protein